MKRSLLLALFLTSCATLTAEQYNLRSEARLQFAMAAEEGFRRTCPSEQVLARLRQAIDDQAVRDGILWTEEQRERLWPVRDGTGEYCGHEGYR